MITAAVDTRAFQVWTKEAAKELNNADRLKLYRALALKFLEKVIPRTPVDNGQARGGWTAASRRLPGVRGIRIGGADRAMEELGRSQSSYKEKGARGGGEIAIEIFNGVPHIVYLELGSSQQAPGGFIRLTTREMMGDLIKGELRRTEAAFRAANIKARRATGLRQGLGPRDPLGRANLLRR